MPEADKPLMRGCTSEEMERNARGVDSMKDATGLECKECGYTLQLSTAVFDMFTADPAQVSSCPAFNVFCGKKCCKPSFKKTFQEEKKRRAAAAKEAEAKSKADAEAKAKEEAEAAAKAEADAKADAEAEAVKKEAAEAEAEKEGDGEEDGAAPAPAAMETE